MPLLAFDLLGLTKRCFLRSRCSMEMWCPDDMGGTAGIGLGRLLGGEHASTPQRGVEAPRLGKRSLPRLYFCCCCFGVFGLDVRYVRSQRDGNATTVTETSLQVPGHLE